MFSSSIDGTQQWPIGQMPGIAQPIARQPDHVDVPELEEGDTSHRPPNAFILYSQTMRSQVRQENPSLSNTEVSRLLGKMWKEVPNEIKLQYKQKAAAMQEQFKREHPDYTYRKARRKRALNELLTKSSNGLAGFPMAPGFPAGDMTQFQAPAMMPFGLQGGFANPMGAQPMGVGEQSMHPANPGMGDFQAQPSQMPFPGMQMSMATLPTMGGNPPGNIFASMPFGQK